MDLPRLARDELAAAAGGLDTEADICEPIWVPGSSGEVWQAGRAAGRGWRGEAGSAPPWPNPLPCLCCEPASPLSPAFLGLRSKVLLVEGTRLGRDLLQPRETSAER